MQGPLHLLQVSNKLTGQLKPQGLQASTRQTSKVQKEPHKEKVPWFNQAYRELMTTAQTVYQKPRRRKGRDLYPTKKTTVLKYVSWIIFLSLKTNSKANKEMQYFSTWSLWRRDHYQQQNNHQREKETLLQEGRRGLTMQQAFTLNLVEQNLGSCWRMSWHTVEGPRLRNCDGETLRRYHKLRWSTNSIIAASIFRYSGEHGEGKQQEGH